MVIGLVRALLVSKCRWVMRWAWIRPRNEWSRAAVFGGDSAVESVDVIDWGKTRNR